MVTYYNNYDFVLCRFPLTRTYMGGGNYLKMSQHKRVEDSVYDSNRKTTLFGEGHQVGRLCHRWYDEVAYPSRYDTSWL